MVASVYFVIKEVLRRTKPGYAEMIESGPPKLPEFYREKTKEE